MPAVIPDDILQAAGLTEQQALIETACRLYDAEILTLHQAMKLAGLSRADFWLALKDRGMPLLHIGDEFLDELTAPLPGKRG